MPNVNHDCNIVVSNKEAFLELIKRKLTVRFSYACLIEIDKKLICRLS